MRITLEHYWMGRDKTHGAELTPVIEANALVLVERVNKLLTYAGGALELVRNPRTGSPLTSGWRPEAINGATPGAAIFSAHMSGEAIDLFDPDGEIDDWLWANQHILGFLDVDLYVEHPSATKGWAHLQTRVPKSQRRMPYNARRRWFYP